MTFPYLKAALTAALTLALGASAALAAKLRAPGGGAVRALVIGLDDYPKLPAASQLRGAKADALDIAQALQADGVTPIVITSPAEATRARFIREMNRLVAESKAGDFVIVTYAGHGMQVEEYSRWQGIEKSKTNEQIVLAGYGATPEAAGEIIVNKELRAWLARLDAKGVDVLVVMDSCFGGGMARNFDPRGGEMVLRQVAGGPNPLKDRFAGIEMTQKEARTEFIEMAHVTFVSGATPNNPVPELRGLPGLDAKQARGALSYFFARALEGRANAGGPLTRKRFYDFAAQNVRQISQESQVIDFQPRSADPNTMGRSVLAFDSEAPPPPEPPPVLGLTPSLGDPVRIALVNAPPAAADKIVKAAAPILIVEGVEQADLIWDVGKGEILAHGDLVMQRADASLVGQAADRAWAVRQIHRLGESRPLAVRLAQEGKAYMPGETPRVEVSELAGQFLTVFNIANDATIEMQSPAAPQVGQTLCRRAGDVWGCPLEVRPPFGAERLVGVATAQEPKALIEWLKAHHGKRDAVGLPDMLRKIAADDPSMRIGTVGLYTLPRS